MKTATVHEIKQELSAVKPAELADLCLRLARFKKENKELLTYLLFEAHDEAAYMAGIKQEIDRQFEEINVSHFYFVKKSLRKILRIISKHVRYMGSRQAEVELLLYFCSKLNASGIRMEKSPVILSIYNNQVKKIQAAVQSLHEDLQYDYLKELALLK
jgi:hypothetical protein